MDVQATASTDETSSGCPGANTMTRSLRRGLVRRSVKLALSAALPRGMLLVRGPARPGAASARVRDVALTFDDGPHPEHTPRLLDLLGSLGIKATFFLLGSQASKYRSIVARIAADAHELGNHTYSHRKLPGQPPGVILDEVRRTRSIIEDITGKPCDLFRPPAGALTPRALWHLWTEGETVVLWSVDSRDYRMKGPAEAPPFCAGYRAQNGDIVLMHDDHATSAAIVRGLAARAAHDGVRFVRVPDLLPGQEWRDHGF
jgi:peptidoglycan/xylan/chitin deacetylase (PgdA/CDA1 family)